MAFLAFAAVAFAVLSLLGEHTAGAATGTTPQAPSSTVVAKPGEVFTLRFHLEDPNHVTTDATKHDMIEMLGRALLAQGIASKVEGQWMDDTTLALVVRYAKATELRPGTSFSDPSGRSLTLTYAVQSPLM